MNTVAVKQKLSAKDQALYDFTQHDQLINKLINTKLRNFNSSDVCLERDDIVNICRAFIMKALRDYDPTRGQKLSSYIYMVLDSRLGNMRARIQKKNLQGTSSLTDLNMWGLTGATDGESSSDNAYSNYKPVQSTVRELMKVEDCAVEAMDVETVYKQLPPFRQTLFKEFFVDGYTVLELFQRHPSVGYHKIRSELKALGKIFKTLCEGNVL